MKGVLPDINLRGPFLAMVSLVLESDYWKDLWRGLGLSVTSFRDWGLDFDAPDDVVWQL